MNDLAKHLSALGLHASADSLDDLLARAGQRRFSPRDLLEEIVHCESALRSRKSLERRLSRSRIGSFKPIADFDWSWPRKIGSPNRCVTEDEHETRLEGRPDSLSGAPKRGSRK
jgi:hypothetical protein